MRGVMAKGGGDVEEEVAWRVIMGEGILAIPGVNAVFLEPSLLLTSSYTHFTLRPDRYYSRAFFHSFRDGHLQGGDTSVETGTGKRERKRKRKKKGLAYSPNPKEKLALQRHQEIHDIILDAHRAFYKMTEAAFVLRSIEDYALKLRTQIGNGTCSQSLDDSLNGEGIDFVKLADLWQAPLYEISLSKVSKMDVRCHEEVNGGAESTNMCSLPLFNQRVENTNDGDMLAECSGKTFVLPQNSAFISLKSINLSQVKFCAQAAMDAFSINHYYDYQTLPNRNLLSLPIRRFAHARGALIGLWVTNREKLRAFVEEELFPAWGVVPAGVWFWLKVRSNGEMISSLDTMHHKPYECLVLGYFYPQNSLELASNQSDTVGSCPQSLSLERPPNRHVFISIPGDHSRKPPIGSLLSRYAPGTRPVKGLELFARELNAGWTSWGNEPLLFQDSKFDFIGACTLYFWVTEKFCMKEHAITCPPFTFDTCIFVKYAHLTDQVFLEK